MPDITTQSLELLIPIHIHSATDGSSLSLIVAGFTSTVEYILVVENTKDDAFQAHLALYSKQT